MPLRTAAKLKRKFKKDFVVAYAAPNPQKERFASDLENVVDSLLNLLRGKPAFRAIGSKNFMTRSPNISCEIIFIFTAMEERQPLAEETLNIGLLE